MAPNIRKGQPGFDARNGFSHASSVSFVQHLGILVSRNDFIDGRTSGFAHTVGEGLTPAQLASSIENGYKSARIFTNPTITIVMQPQARFVNIGGAVRAPARIPFTEDMTLLTAISAAGGFNDFADQKRVRLLRGSVAKSYDVRQFRRDPGLDPKLQPGDKIEVPQSFF